MRVSLHKSKKSYIVSFSFVFFLICISFISNPAFAHDQITEQSPISGEILTVAPHEVTLTFSTNPLEVGAKIIVIDAYGKQWESGEPSYQGKTVIQKLLPNMPDGNYQVRWRVIVSDGDPISESFLFSIGDSTNSPQVTIEQSSNEIIREKDSSFTSTITANQNTSKQSQSNIVRKILFAGGGAIYGVLFFSIGYVVANMNKK